MNTLKVITNNVPRNMIYGYELSDKEKKEFDYLDQEELDTGDFVRYKGTVYHIGQFLHYGFKHNGITWDGYHGDTFFSGILIKLVNNCEQVIMARYYTTSEEQAK